ncbi:DUF488 domain-containing protein [Streptomyces sp. NBC_01497]|uniref:DUF488 domain-containing protein n=1 Tax=Streptomyces sp. NBC_01497 TaxID=2903885 RepID=UPI002E2FF5E8|nr:DUF488 family protein [Streptomyces sp. NBC_01497]
MKSRPHVRAARVYEPPQPNDGIRILVDRLWPRGLSKEVARLDVWCKNVAPSTELRRWYGHEAQRFTEFVARYEAELTSPCQAQALGFLAELCRQGPVTLLTATREVSLSHAAVLIDALVNASD